MNTHLNPASVSFSQVSLSTWLWVTSGVISRPCLRQLWNVMLPCLSATMRERSGGSSQQLSVIKHFICILSSEWISWFAVSASQAVEELLAELDLDRKSIVVGASRVRTCLNSSNQTAEHESSGCDLSWVFLLCLRYSWSEGCCATWSSRGTSRSPAGWSIYRPPAWDIWPVRNTANSRLVSLCNDDCPALIFMLMTHCCSLKKLKLK